MSCVAQLGREGTIYGVRLILLSRHSPLLRRPGAHGIPLFRKHMPALAPSMAPA